MAAPHEELPQIEVSLVHDQQVVVPQAAPWSIRKVDTGRERSWADGRPGIRTTPVAEVVQRFNRSTVVQIQYTIRSSPPASERRLDASNPELSCTFPRIGANFA